MQTSSDKHYIQTKKVLTGELKLSETKKQLINWIQNKYGIVVYNIEFDKIDQEKRKRINIIVAKEDDYQKMHHDGPDYWGYDKTFQGEILKEYYNIFGEPKKSVFTLFEKAPKKPWVCYHVFNQVAISEANGKIGTKKLSELTEKFQDLDIWQIVQFFGATIIFHFNDEQIKKHKNSKRFEELKECLFKEIKKHDEFQLMNNFHLNQDSKENLDKNYEGNFYYYFK